MLEGKLVTISLLSGKLIVGSVVGDDSKFVVLKDGFVEGNDAKYVAVHKNQILLAGASNKKSDVEGKSLDVFVNRRVKVYLLRGLVVTGKFKGVDDRFVVVEDCELRGKIQLPTKNFEEVYIHKNQVELLHTVD